MAEQECTAAQHSGARATVAWSAICGLRCHRIQLPGNTTCSTGRDIAVADALSALRGEPLLHPLWLTSAERFSRIEHVERVTPEKMRGSTAADRWGWRMLEVLDKGSVTAAHPVPLLFIHGAAHGAWCWDEHFLDFFSANGYRALAINLRDDGDIPMSKIRWRRVRWPIVDGAPRSPPACLLARW